jgi:hypothetical protein
MRPAYIHQPQNRGQSKLCFEVQPRPVVDDRVRRESREACTLIGVKVAPVTS